MMRRMEARISSIDCPASVRDWLIDLRPTCTQSPGLRGKSCYHESRPVNTSTQAQQAVASRAASKDEGRRGLEPRQGANRGVERHAAGDDAGPASHERGAAHAGGPD